MSSSPITTLLDYFTEMLNADQAFFNRDKSDDSVNELMSTRERIYNRYWCRGDDYWLDNSYSSRSDYDIFEEHIVRVGTNHEDLVSIEILAKDPMGNPKPEIYLLKLNATKWFIFDRLSSIDNYSDEMA